MLAFLLSLVLVAVNIGQIITILVPLINSHASPDHNYRRNDANRRMKCGYGSEVTAVSGSFGLLTWNINLFSVGPCSDNVNLVGPDCLFHYKTVYHPYQRPRGKSQERQSTHGDAWRWAAKLHMSGNGDTYLSAEAKSERALLNNALLYRFCTLLHSPTTA